MSFELPKYLEPDFDTAFFRSAPDAALMPAPADGVAPKNFHATGIFPEYLKHGGKFRLIAQSRMDCAVVNREGEFFAVELRNLKKGDAVAVGRTEQGEEGIYVHANCFESGEKSDHTFAFRQSRTRESSHAKDYDHLAELLKYEKLHGSVLFVLGPACSFDRDSRIAMCELIDSGFVQGMLSGNALATHDLEGSYFSTALGQNIYTQEIVYNGHYHHLDTLNRVRELGSMEEFIKDENISGGILHSVIKNRVPYVLTGSIRDDGPLPEVYSDAYAGQDAMRALIAKATTIICLATTLHTIATGNMTPIYRVKDGVIRPLFFNAVDISEFSLNKLKDRGSMSVKTFITNAQDFIVNLANRLI